MKINPETNAISVHGREALSISYKRWGLGEDGARQQLDISATSMFLEIPGGPIRRALIADTSDPKGLRIYLERSDVARIPTAPTPYIVVDETNPAQPVVELEGSVVRTGYKGEPTPPVRLD
jgi:hypothetical protein